MLRRCTLAAVGRGRKLPSRLQIYPPAAFQGLQVYPPEAFPSLDPHCSNAEEESRSCGKEAWVASHVSETRSKASGSRPCAAIALEVGGGGILASQCGKEDREKYSVLTPSAESPASTDFLKWTFTIPAYRGFQNSAIASQNVVQQQRGLLLTNLSQMHASRNWSRSWGVEGMGLFRQAGDGENRLKHSEAWEGRVGIKDRTSPGLRVEEGQRNLDSKCVFEWKVSRICEEIRASWEEAKAQGEGGNAHEVGERMVAVLKTWEVQIGNAHVTSVLRRMFSGPGGASHLPEAAVRVFRWFCDETSFRVQSHQVSVMVSILGHARRYELLDSLLEEASARSIPCNQVVFGALINAYAKGGKFREAEMMLEMLCQTYEKPNTWPFTSLMSAYDQQKRHAEALQVFQKMVGLRIRPDCTTYDVLLRVYHGLGMRGELMSLWEDIKQKNEQVYGTMIGILGQSNRVHDAEFLLKKMKEEGFSPSVNIFMLLAHGYALQGNKEEALRILDRIEEERLHPNTAVFNNILGFLVKLATDEDVLDVVRRMKEAQVSPDEATYSILLDFYARKCKVDKVYKVCEIMKEKGVKINHYSYGTLICMHSKLGHKEQALQFFREMRDSREMDRFVPHGPLLAMLVKKEDVVNFKDVWQHMKASFGAKPPYFNKEIIYFAQSHGLH